MMMHFLSQCSKKNQTYVNTFKPSNKVAHKVQKNLFITAELSGVANNVLGNAEIKIGRKNESRAKLVNRAAVCR